MTGPSRTLLSALAALVVALGGPAGAQDSEPTPASLWDDFNHFVLIARPDLAQAAGSALLEKVNDAELLEVVEAGNYPNYEDVLLRAQKVEAVREVAAELEKRILAARIGRSRDPQRIAADIQLLAEGRRQRRNAVMRLASAGQYAAPYLLATLEDSEQERLHPYVFRAMVAVGEPLVAPLSVALPKLEPVPMAQVAQILGEIGYPQALPYIKQVLEAPDTDPSARRVAQAAYDVLSQSVNVPRAMDASTLFLLLGQAQYRLGTNSPNELPGYDPSEGKGIVWAYGRDIGLVPIPVPGEIFGDVLAMRSAQQSLDLDQTRDPALSLWLMADMRRENNLPEGQQDPANTELQPAMYYAMLAGPDRMHDVLRQSLADSDSALALDAIRALSLTAGRDALVTRSTVLQPLLDAMQYPDRRVRFRAAEALTNAHPQQPFPDSFRVVPVLSEAVRQDENRYALVLVDDQEKLNSLMAAVNDLGFEAIGEQTVSGALPSVKQSPGIDLIVVDKTITSLNDVVEQTRNDYYLGSTPILALVPPDLQGRVFEQHRKDPRVHLTSDQHDSQSLRDAVEEAAKRRVGEPLSPEESTQFALTALDLLRGIALENNVYRIADAEPQLVRAMNDPRPELVEKAGMVLALVNSPQAQQALAEAALAQQGDLQVSLLGSLSESARFFGNQLTGQQVQRLLALVNEAGGDAAIAAAEAHGALSLPTSEAVKSILQ